MNCSTPGFAVLHFLLEFTQTHVYWVGDAIQLSHPLSPSSPAFNLSQHQGLFRWVGSSHQVAKVLELQLQSSALPMNSQGWLTLGLNGLISLLSKGLWRVFCNTTIQKHQFLGTCLTWVLVLVVFQKASFHKWICTWCFWLDSRLSRRNHSTDKPSDLQNEESLAASATVSGSPAARGYIACCSSGEYQKGQCPLPSPSPMPGRKSGQAASRPGPWALLLILESENE